LPNSRAEIMADENRHLINPAEPQNVRERFAIIYNIFFSLLKTFYFDIDLVLVVSIGLSVVEG
jgi:hypothetical protein